MRSKRFEALAKRPVNQDGFVKEWIEEGFIAMESPNDPKPSIRIVDGVVTELDGKPASKFDLIDHFIARYGINLDRAEEVMAMDSVKLANMLCDPNVKRSDIVPLTTAMTPAKIVEVVSHMNVVEMMMSMQKMRARRTPSQQAHVTNVRDNPVQIAADAAEGAFRGFDEQEATELKLGMLGHTCYAETISVYGTEPVFTDGDDTPWSKGFLASSYASRGLKMRFTSGSGSEVQMGYAEGKSMLYLEARCIYITKAAGVQGLQNGSVSCIGVPSAVPSGIRAVLAENLICSSIDLECASSNDQTFTHSDMRRTARLLMQFLPGTDFISSGYSAVPNYDNMFAGSNEDAEDFDDYNIIQRDLKVDGGLRPVREEDVVAVRNKAARALQAVFAGMGLPAITDDEVTAATYAHGSKDMPERNIVEDLKAAQEIIEHNRTGLEVVKALAQGGFADVAQDMLNIQKAKISGDYLHTSAIIVGDNQVLSAVNDVNDYAGPGTGYRLEGARWEEIKNIPNALDPNELG